ncbi:MAG: hypothetical protein L3K09_02515 [Thermoplasmata archaeon]|nr:hypothetical protein [Thermoplasmata archaeon]
MSMLSVAYVQCKNPDCRNEFAAPFGVKVRLMFGQSGERELACPFCRKATTYGSADYHAKAVPSARETADVPA